MFRVVFCFLLFCTSFAKAQPLILISKDKYGEIQKWIHSVNPQIITKECYGLPADSITYYLKMAHGLILGGGEDLYPGLYGKQKEIQKCGKIDTYRDSMEFFLLSTAFQKKLPTLGICRGMQLLNVYFGGDLYVDLPTDRPSKINHSQFGKKEVHPIKQITPKSQIFDALQSKEFMVNSSHHQAIGKLSSNFRAVAQSPDGILEAIEWNSLADWFAFGIQWHPERLEDLTSQKLMDFFLSQINRTYSEQTKGSDQ